MLTRIFSTVSSSRFILIIAVLFLASCASQQQTPADVPSPPSMGFDQNSWKTIIPDSCQSFSDGCNNCRRAEGSEIAACTRRFCQTYKKPECLDKQANTTPQTTQLSCSDDSHFSVVRGLYISDDQRVKLKDNQIMLINQQTHTASLLERSVSASGEKYSDTHWAFWSKEDEAIVLKDGEILYRECQAQ